MFTRECIGHTRTHHMDLAPEMRRQPHIQLTPFPRPQELFRRINAALQAYQASRDREALVASVIATLDRPEQFALLAGFSLFLPKAERAGFRNRIG